MNPDRDRTRDIDVRLLDDTEADAYVRFLFELDAETRFLMWEPGERTLTPEDVRARLRDPDRAERRATFVAVDAGGIAGFLVAIRGVPRRVRHKADFSMGLLPRIRGTGTGARLIDAMFDWAKGLGLERLELTVMAHNEAAIRLYVKKGFAKEGVKRNSIHVDRKPVDEIIMGKLLD